MLDDKGREVRDDDGTASDDRIDDLNISNDGDVNEADEATEAAANSDGARERFMGVGAGPIRSCCCCE
jgi:hypothetical protein